MQKIRERVNHRNVASGRETLDFAVVKRAHDQAMHETRKDFCGVFHGFTAAELDIVFVEEKRIAAELVDTDFEGHARARRGLGKNHRPGLTGEWGRSVATALGFEFSGQRKDFAQFMGLEVGLFQEVFHRLKRKI